MLKIIIILSFVVLSFPCKGQTNAQTVFVTVAPSGSCQARANIRYLVPGGLLYTCQNGSWSTSNSNGLPVGWVDPITSYNASGSNATTTGTATTGAATTLMLASGTGWSSGMGIAIAGAGPAGAELVTACTTVSGTTCILASGISTNVSGATVNHDDTAALAGAIASGKNVHLRAGNYNVTGSNNTLYTITSSIFIQGDGWAQSIIWYRGTTSNIFWLDTENTGASATFPGTVISDIQVAGASGFTPTAGSAFIVASISGGNQWVGNTVITRIAVANMCNGLQSGGGVAVAQFTHSKIYYGTCVNSGFTSGGILFSTPSPGGDWVFDDITLLGPKTGINILAADTNTWSNVKINGSGLLVDPSNAGIGRQRFINLNVEGNTGSPSCGIQLGGSHGGASQIELIGGAVGFDLTTGICANGQVGLRVLGMHFYNLTNGIILGSTSNASIVGNDFLSTGTAVSFATSSTGTVTGNTVESSVTAFMTSDASVSKVTACGNSNPSSIPNTLNGATTLTCGN